MATSKQQEPEQPEPPAEPDEQQPEPPAEPELVTVLSKTYPELWVHDLDVHFHEGTAQVDPAKVDLDVLCSIDGVRLRHSEDD